MNLSIFSCKEAYCVKSQDFFHNFFLNCAFYLLDTVPEPDPEPELKPVAEP
jgi:hypothetical protein